jgi:hypothetical protein
MWSTLFVIWGPQANGASYILIMLMPRQCLGSRIDSQELEVRASSLYVLRGVQVGFGAEPQSYPMGTEASFPSGYATHTWRWLLTCN